MLKTGYTLRCDFYIAQEGANFIAIVDRNGGGMSVTNDAEAVCSSLHRQGKLPKTRFLIYRDSDGRWDQLVHDGEGKFLGFATIG
jgi:hypothetical protein